jgi:hypothetical protein
MEFVCLFVIFLEGFLAICIIMMPSCILVAMGEHGPYAGFSTFTSRPVFPKVGCTATGGGGVSGFTWGTWRYASAELVARLFTTELTLGHHNKVLTLDLYHCINPYVANSEIVSESGTLFYRHYLP